MAKSETAQIAQLDERIKSLDANIKQLITDVDAFKDRLSKTNSSGVEQMKREYQSLQKKVEEVGMSQAKTAKNVEEQIQRISRSRRVDNKILERQNQLLAAQKRLAATGDIGQRFSTLRNSIGGIDFNSILAKANAPTDKGFKMLHDSGSETAVRRFVSAQNEAKKSVEKTTSSIKAQKGSLESMLPTLRRLASAFGVAFSVQGLVNFGKKLIETRGEFELQQVALRSILQNKQLADEIWDKTMQAALQSPFTAMQLTKYTKQLAAYRIETDKLFDTTKRLADVSAGLGVDMQRLILAYGQVKAANYLRASEIRQFTEAGVNILGELSTYLSATRGELISTAQVMDMVQKRMVTFEDVEAIFKRMTDEGGIFYNMQYVQSQTVKGQINKLHDAYDQMLNSIGKANEGTLKNMVAILNNIVKNWREWKTILDTIAWPAIGLALAKFSTGLLGVGASSVVATSGISALTKAGARLQIVLKRLMLNPWIAGASVAIAGVSWVINHAKAVKALNDRYDELNVRAIETKNNFDDYTKTVEDNNNKIRENQSILKTARRGSEEYEKAQNDLNEAQKSNSGIVAKLNTDYPEIAEKVSIANDNWVDLGDSIRIANEELENTILLNQMAKATFGNADLQSDISNAIESANKRLQIAAENRAKALKKIAQGTASDLDKAIANARDWAEQVAIIRQYEQGHWENQWMGAERGVQAVFVKRASGYKIPGEQGLQTTSQQLAKIRDDIKQQDMALREELHTVLMANKEFAKKITEEYEGNYEAFIEGNRKAVEKYMKYGEGEGWKMWNKFMVNYYSNAWGQKDVSQTVISSIQNLRPYGLDLLIDPNKKQTTGGMTGDGDDDGSKAKKNASRLISLIREMRAEYDKLSKSAYGYAKSEDTVRKAYDRAMDEILVKAGVDKKYDFTTNEGMIAALERVKTYAQTLGPEAAAEVEKYIGQLKTEMTIDTQVRIREDFGRQMEEAFGNYELTLELQKLNLPSDVLEDMFDIEAIDTPALRSELERLYDTLKDENGEVADESFKVYENWLKKIDDAEQKLQRDRLKSYSKYLEYQVSERAKIEMDYIRKVAEVQAESALGGENEGLRKRILEGLDREKNEKLAKQDWEDFKGSEMYIQMMEDLTRQGTASLEVMRKKLLEVRDNAENLSPRALKEVINALEKIDDEFYNRQQPFARVRHYKHELEKAMQEAQYDNIAGVFTDDAAAKEDYENSKRLHDQYENIIGDKKTLADVTKKLTDITSEYNIQGETEEERIANARKMLERYRAMLKSDINERNNMGGRTKENADVFDETVRFINNDNEAIGKLEAYINLMTQYSTLMEKMKGTKYENMSIEELSALSKEQMDAMGWSKEEQVRLGAIIKLWRQYNKSVSDALTSINDYISRIETLYDSVTSNLGSFGIQTDVLSEQWVSSAKVMMNSIKTLIDAIKEYKENVQEALDDGKNLLEAGATGDYVRLALALLKVLVDVVAQIGLIRDASYEKQIQKQQERIDALQDAYARLERQIEKTWSSVSYMQTYEQQVQNIREQIDAMEAQMRAEEAKKNTDDNAVRQYQRDIQDAYDQLDELEQKSIEVFGGIGEEGYRSAAEGFVEAWKSAFLETGDGLQGLQDHFNEFLQDWFLKQATMRIAGGMLEPVFRQIDAAVDKYGEGGTSAMLSEIERVRDMAAAIFPDLSLALEDLAGMFGVGGEGSLSGLAAGIQGMTEEQANILEAYWNSVRMYTASIDQNVAMIASALGVGGNSPSTNPQLQQLQLIAASVQATHQLLQSTSRSGHPMGGYGFKVFND